MIAGFQPSTVVPTIWERPFRNPQSLLHAKVEEMIEMWWISDPHCRYISLHLLIWWYLMCCSMYVVYTCNKYIYTLYIYIYMYMCLLSIHNTSFLHLCTKCVHTYMHTYVIQILVWSVRFLWNYTPENWWLDPKNHRKIFSHPPPWRFQLLIFQG